MTNSQFDMCKLIFFKEKKIDVFELPIFRYEKSDRENQLYK